MAPIVTAICPTSRPACASFPESIRSNVSSRPTCPPTRLTSTVEIPAARNSSPSVAAGGVRPPSFSETPSDFANPESLFFNVSSPYIVRSPPAPTFDIEMTDAGRPVAVNASRYRLTPWPPEKRASSAMKQISGSGEIWSNCRASSSITATPLALSFAPGEFGTESKFATTMYVQACAERERAVMFVPVSVSGAETVTVNGEPFAAAASTCACAAPATVTTGNAAVSPRFAVTVPLSEFTITSATAPEAHAVSYFSWKLAPPRTVTATFPVSPPATTPIGSGNDAAYGMALQSDGGIVLAGVSSNGSNNDFCVARLNPDGTLDASFDGPGGSGETPPSETPEPASAILAGLGLPLFFVLRRRMKKD